MQKNIVVSFRFWWTFLFNHLNYIKRIVEDIEMH